MLAGLREEFINNFVFFALVPMLLVLIIIIIIPFSKDIQLTILDFDCLSPTIIMAVADYNSVPYIH